MGEPAIPNTSSFSVRLRRILFFLTLCGFEAAVPGARGQNAEAVAHTARIHGAVDPTPAVRLKGHVPAWATAENDQGALNADQRLDNLHLVLQRAPAVQAAFEQLLADQQNPASPRYHQWLTPQQNAEQYGIAPSDLTAVTDWLRGRGLSVDDVAAGGVFITFSGPVAAVENAFAVQLHTFAHEGAARIAPDRELALPAALTGVVADVSGLAESFAQIHSHRQSANATFGEEGAHPLYTLGGGHSVAPADFNQIYDVAAAFNSGITGTNNRVAVLIDSRVNASDISGYQSFFGVTAVAPTTIVVQSSSDPGVKSASEGEADLDVQRVMGTAPGAGIDLVVFSSLSFSLIHSALQYEIGTLNDPVVNMSFGSCNAQSGAASESATLDAYFKSGAAQGISFFVSSGDNAAADCDSASSTIPSSQVLSTNLICASSYVTCVGGTEFADSLNPSAYWSSTNNPTTKLSAVGYIPEGAWNEPTTTSNGATVYQASGTGGGVTSFPKPSWQTGAGVPVDGFRDVPDVSFTAAGHDGYRICQADIGDNCSTGSFNYVILGTSASAPSMAGVAALLNQKLGARQGNINPLLYQLAGNTTNGAFHDMTVASSGVSNCSTATPSICNNSTSSANSLSGGLAGYALTAGYDQATGLGSLDVAKFLAAAAAPTVTFSLSPATTALAFSAGAAAGNTDTITVSPVNGFTGTVNLTCATALTSGSSAAYPPTCTLSTASVTLSSSSAATVVATIGSSAQTGGCTSMNSLPSFRHGPEIALGSFLLLLLPCRRRRALRTLAMLALAAFGLAALNGCGGSGGASNNASTCPTVITPGTTKGSYTVTVTGTSGSITNNATFSVTIN